MKIIAGTVKKLFFQLCHKLLVHIQQFLFAIPAFNLWGFRTNIHSRTLCTWKRPLYAQWSVPRAHARLVYHLPAAIPNPETQYPPKSQNLPNLDYVPIVRLRVLKVFNLFSTLCRQSVDPHYAIYIYIYTNMYVCMYV